MKYLITSLLIAVACLAGNTDESRLKCQCETLVGAGFITVTNSIRFGPLIHDNLTWESRDKTLVMHRREELVTNWITAETIDLGDVETISILGPTRLNRLIQVGKIVTNEVIRIEFQHHTNFVTYTIGDSGYTAQRWITNKAFLSSSITFQDVTH